MGSRSSALCSRPVSGKVRVTSGIHFAATCLPHALCRPFPFFFFFKKWCPRKRESDTPTGFSCVWIFQCQVYDTQETWSFSCSCSYTLDATCLEPRAVSMHWPRLKINVKQMLAPHGRTHVCSPPSFDPAVSCFLSENGEMFGFFPWKQEMQGGSPRLTASSPFSKILHSVSAPKGIHGHFYPVNLTRGAAHKLAIRNQYSRWPQPHRTGDNCV